MTDGYTATYGADEASEVSIDLLVAVGAGFVSFATLIGLIILYGWMRKKVPKV